MRISVTVQLRGVVDERLRRWGEGACERARGRAERSDAASRPLPVRSPGRGSRPPSGGGGQRSVSASAAAGRVRAGRPAGRRVAPWSVSGLAEPMVRATLDADDALVVPDTRVDPRFRMNPLVNGRPGIGFYAGQPLTDAGGHRLGVLSLLDTRRAGSPTPTPTSCATSPTGCRRSWRPTRGWSGPSRCSARCCRRQRRSWRATRSRAAAYPPATWRATSSTTSSSATRCRCRSPT